MANSKDGDPPDDEPVQIEFFPEIRPHRPEPPPGKIEICRPYITVRGKRLYASTYGRKAWCFYVDAGGPHG